VRDANANCPPEIFAINIQKEHSVAFKIRQNPFSAGSALDPAGELTTLLQTLYSRLERRHPSPYPTLLCTESPIHLRRSPGVPQNSSQICAYVCLWVEMRRMGIVSPQRRCMQAHMYCYKNRVCPSVRSSHPYTTRWPWVVVTWTLATCVVTRDCSVRIRAVRSTRAVRVARTQKSSSFIFELKYSRL